MNSIPSLQQYTLPPGLDTSFLRKEAQQYLEAWASSAWTDYNTHDPGITILELLAYAITDLGLRTRQEIVNLMGGGDKSA